MASLVEEQEQGESVDSESSEEEFKAKTQSSPVNKRDRPTRNTKKPDFLLAQQPSPKKQRSTRKKQASPVVVEPQSGHSEEDDESEEYEVEAVVAQRIKNNRLEYSVKWRGYDSADNTWEPAENLADCSALDFFLSSIKPQSSQLPRSSDLNSDEVPELTVGTTDPDLE